MRFEGLGEVRLQRDGAIATVTLANAARRNAIDVGMWRALRMDATELAADGAVRIVVLRGEGSDVFSAGADISEFDEWRSTADRGFAYQTMVHDAIESFARLPQPVVAMVHGPCLGGACELAVACDLRFASREARFGIPAANLSVQVDLSEIARLVALIGPARARELLYTGDYVDAAWCERVGLVDRVFSADRLEAETYAWTARVADNAPLSIRWSKWGVERAMRDPDLSETRDHLERGRGQFETDDYREGRRAFLEKRRPRFSGR